MKIGRSCVFGVRDPLPLAGFPPGRCRIIQRAGEFVRVIVRTPSGTRFFTVEEKNGRWTPAFEQAPNRRSMLP